MTEPLKCICLIPDLPGADCAACASEALEWAETGVALAAADGNWPKWELLDRAIAHKNSCEGCDLCRVVDLADLISPTSHPVGREGSDHGRLLVPGMR